MLHTFEINDEQEDFTRPWLEKSPFADKIRFYIGDALELVPDLGVTFDLAFIDGDKRKYIEYYEMTLATRSLKALMPMVWASVLRGCSNT